MSPTQRPDTLMQDRPPPARRNPLATHGRTIHPGQSRRSRHVRDMSALPPTAVDLVRCSETTRCAMCGRIWTPPDCNGVRHVEDQGPQLLTYIRLPDAAYVGVVVHVRQARRGFSADYFSSLPCGGQEGLELGGG